MTILILAEHDNAALNPATAKAVSAANAIGGDIHVLVAGADAQAVGDQAAKLDGVAKVLLADAPYLANGLAEEVSALLVSMMGSYDVLIAPATASGKNILPRVAALLDGALAQRELRPDRRGQARLRRARGGGPQGAHL